MFFSCCIYEYNKVLFPHAHLLCYKLYCFVVMLCLLSSILSSLLLFCHIIVLRIIVMPIVLNTLSQAIMSCIVMSKQCSGWSVRHAYALRVYNYDMHVRERHQRHHHYLIDIYGWEFQWWQQDVICFHYQYNYNLLRSLGYFSIWLATNLVSHINFTFFWRLLENICLTTNHSCRVRTMSS